MSHDQIFLFCYMLVVGDLFGDVEGIHNTEEGCIKIHLTTGTNWHKLSHLNSLCCKNKRLSLDRNWLITRRRYHVVTPQALETASSHGSVQRRKIRANSESVTEICPIT